MTETILSVRNLTKSFGAITASNDVSFNLHTGEIHALIGPNGAGKTTLIKQITGEIFHDSGEIEFCARNISSWGEVDRARMGLTRSFQISSLALEFTTLQNVMISVIGQKKATFGFFKPVMRNQSILTQAMIQLRKVGLADRASIVASELSHGERRKLEIAMALAMEPKAFLLDEPMAGMGPEGSRSLTELLGKLKYDAPILLIEHDMDAVFSLADRISVLVYGEIIATGSVFEIRNNALVREIYRGQEL